MPQTAYETPATILSRQHSTPRTSQQPPYYYYLDDPSSSIPDHLEYRAAPLGFGVKKTKSAGQSNKNITPAHTYDTPKREKQSRKKTQSKGRGGWQDFDHSQGPGSTWVRDDGRTFSTIHHSQGDSRQRTTAAESQTALHAWPDVPKSGRRRAEYKDQSTQTDAVTISIDDMYAAIIAHQAQEDVVPSSTQGSEHSRDESYYQSGESGGFGFEVDINAASSGSTYSFQSPVEAEVQYPSSNGTTGSGEITAMTTDFDLLDPVTVMEMAILRGWTDMDFGMQLGTGTDTTEGTINPVWTVGQPIWVEGVPAPIAETIEKPSYPPVGSMVEKILEPFPYGLPSVHDIVGGALDPPDMMSNESIAAGHRMYPELSMTSVYTTRSLPYAEADRTQRERASLAGKCLDLRQDNVPMTHADLSLFDRARVPRLPYRKYLRDQLVVTGPDFFQRCFDA